MVFPFPRWKQRFLVVHLEDLANLWNQRLQAWAAGTWTRDALRKLDRRIAAHADAVALAGEEAVEPLQEALEGAELPAVLGAAHVLLGREDRDGVDRAQATCGRARGLAAEAFRIALRHAPLGLHLGFLRDAARGEDERLAAGAISAFAFQGVPEDLGRLPALLDSGDAAVRRLGWEAVAYLGAGLVRSTAAGLREVLAERARAAASRETDAAVRAAALEGAAWTGQRWLVPHLRSVAARTPRTPEDLPALRLLAILAEDADADVVLAAARDPDLGPERASLFAALGRAEGMEDLLAELGGRDRASVAAAARAFRRWTGVDLPQRPAEDREDEGDDEDAGAAEDLPDAAAARAWWEDTGRAVLGRPDEDVEDVPLGRVVDRALREGARLAELERLQR
jgi:hypothetical protein